MKKLEKESFEQYLKEEANAEYSLIGDFNGVNRKVKLKHNINTCGYEWDVLPSNFLYHKTRCPECNNLNRRDTNAEFKQKLTNKYGEEYIPIDKYINSYTKIRILHTKCGNIIMKRPNDILNGYECDICNKYHKKTDEEFKEELRKIYGEEFIVLEEYKGAHIPMYFQHDCSKVFQSKPYMILSGQKKCPQCKENKTPTEEEIREMIESAPNGEEYLLVSGYKNMNEKVKILHKKCGNTFLMKPTEFLRQNHRCTCCRNVSRYDTKSFCNKVLEKTEGGYLPLGEYMNNKIKITMKHLRCGHIWDVRPDSFLHGSRCPQCNDSKGNRKIRKYLKDNNIKYTAEYKIKECSNKRMLPFDFAIFDEDDNLKLLIEYQGRQHYEPVEKFDGKKGFKERIKNDKIKKDYCTANNINFLEICYKDLEITNEIIENAIKEINLNSKVNKY